MYHLLGLEAVHVRFVRIAVPFHNPIGRSCEDSTLSFFHRKIKAGDRVFKFFLNISFSIICCVDTGFAENGRLMRRPPSIQAPIWGVCQCTLVCTCMCSRG